MPKVPEAQGVKQIAILRKSLEEANERSHAWKSVADNRLLYMEAVDKSLGNFLVAMKALNTVFGLATPRTKHIPANREVHSGEEIYGLTCKKAISLMTYMDRLAIEASRVQDSLDSVLKLATDAMQVSSPTMDSGTKVSVVPLTMDSLQDELERAERDEIEESTSAIDVDVQAPAAPPTMSSLEEELGGIAEDESEDSGSDDEEEEETDNESDNEDVPAVNGSALVLTSQSLVAQKSPKNPMAAFA